MTDGYLEVRSRLNGAAWFQALHRVLSISGATGASFSGWVGGHEGSGPSPFRGGIYVLWSDTSLARSRSTPHPIGASVVSTNTGPNRQYGGCWDRCVPWYVQQMAALLTGFSTNRATQDSSSSHLVKVSAITARVLCPKWLGENDETFRFCQFCAKPSNFVSEGENPGVARSRRGGYREAR